MSEAVLRWRVGGTSFRGRAVGAGARGDELQGARGGRAAARGRRVAHRQVLAPQLRSLSPANRCAGLVANNDPVGLDCVENTDKGRGLGPAPAAASPHAHEGLAPGARSRPR